MIKGTFRHKCRCSCGHSAKFTTGKASQWMCPKCVPSVARLTHGAARQKGASA